MNKDKVENIEVGIFILCVLTMGIILGLLISYLVKPEPKEPEQPEPVIIIKHKNKRLSWCEEKGGIYNLYFEGGYINEYVEECVILMGKFDRKEIIRE